MIRAENRISTGTNSVPARRSASGGSAGAPLFWVFVGLGWIIWSARLFITIGTTDFSAPLAGTVGGIALIAYGALRPKRIHPGASLAILAITLTYSIAWLISLVYQSPNLGTDEAAFVQYAGQLLAHGVNPYARNLATALQQYHVVPSAWTYTLVI